MIIDYSALAAWQFCPGKWYERYVNRRRRKWPHGQRDDAMALGSLVHEGLRVWQLDHELRIPEEVQDEVLPTRECLAQAQELVLGYTRRYPEERWPLVRCEEPLQLPLSPASEEREGISLLAKVDSYFYVPEATQIESGLPEGAVFTLDPGWWIHEYKTKSPFIPMGIYMQGWEMNLQASFQTMALAHHIRSTQLPDPTGGAQPVRGILINVLEKGKRYIPKRKCKSCAEYYEFAMWRPTGKGTYTCPVCGVAQALQPLKEAPVESPPTYYRIVVTRTQEALEIDRAHILATAERMQHMAEAGLMSEPWHKGNCVDTRWKSACEYFAPHTYLRSTTTEDDQNYEAIPDYRGLPEPAKDTQ